MMYNMNRYFKTAGKEMKTMRKNFGAKPWLYPMPVLMIGTYDENGENPELIVYKKR